MVGARRRRLYERASALLQRWSFDSLRPPRHRRPRNGAVRVAYVLLRYPGQTDTFVRREILALRGAGVTLDVFARAAGDVVTPVDPGDPAGPVTYVGPADTALGRAAIRRYMRSKPWTVIRLWLFIVRHGSRDVKAWWRDRDILYEAARLSVTLSECGITRIHAPWADHAALLAFLASRLLGVPFTVQARASEIHRRGRAPVVFDVLRFADHVITNSRYNERFLASLLARRAPPIHTIYNGVELGRFLPAAVNGPSRVPRVLSVGRLVEPKGFRHLLRACQLLRDRGCDFTCEIIGGPRDADDTVTWLELRKLHTALDLGPIVRFRGTQPFSAVLEAYRRSDVFVLPCVVARDGSHDITPNALIEAMAMALPVVSTTSGAIPEIVDHGINGLLVAPTDEQALAEAIHDLLCDAPRRQALGAAARRKVEERFDITRNVAQRVELFEDSADARRLQRFREEGAAP